ncbi:MAG: outer membrane beta-barrel protein [Thermodesulfobacteriota bacterium]|nr:outer membrane beta-barrel protein [Thermodesulfobacteriota bacterium]
MQRVKCKYQMNHKSQTLKERSFNHSMLRAFCSLTALRLTLSRLAPYALRSLYLAIYIALFSSVANADVGDFFSKFHPYLTVQEEYNDNIYLTSTNRKSDFITTINPGLRFSTSPARVTTPGQILQAPAEPAGLDLDYRLGLVFYARENENDYVSHEGTLNTWYTFNRRLTLRLRDYFIRSEEPREREYVAGALEDQYLLGTQRERSVYIRNVFEPSVDYRFGPDDRISINYRNNIYRNQSPLIEDSREDYINPRLTYWFNIRNGISLEYGLTFGDFERSPDFVGHMARGRYTYRFNPRTSVFVDHTFTRRNFDPPSIDYDVNNSSIGIEHAFTPTLTGRMQAGYFWQNPERGNSTDGFSYDVGLTERTEKTTFNLSFQGGYREDFFTAENLGFTRYHRGIASITHRLYQRVTLGVSGTLERAEYVSDRKDWIYGARGNASYQIFRWLSLFLEASHQGNDSNLDAVEYIENRIFLRLSATL